MKKIDFFGHIPFQSPAYHQILVKLLQYKQLKCLKISNNYAVFLAWLITAEDSYKIYQALLNHYESYYDKKNGFG